MTVEKMTISMDEELAAAVRATAGGNVSGWLAEAARARLRQIEAQEILTDFEEEHGAITEAELRKIKRLWPV